MKELLRDLFAHQAWADALHWQAIRASPAATADPAIRERLHHIHLVQRAFLAIEAGSPLTRTSLSDYPDLAELEADARRYHDAAAAFIREVSEARLLERITVPWFNEPPLELSVGEAMLQAVMHSHYHRGQNATRLRELGGEPPLTDLIVWMWRGRPAPVWS
jgi:uncharacterized damage-inducible protein DinB